MNYKAVTLIIVDIGGGDEARFEPAKDVWKFRILGESVYLDEKDMCALQAWIRDELNEGKVPA